MAKRYFRKIAACISGFRSESSLLSSSIRCRGAAGGPAAVEHAALRRLVGLVGLSILICGDPAGAIAAPSISISNILRLQPGWVRVYLQVGDPPINPQFLAVPTCTSPTSASSVAASVNNGATVAIDLKVDPIWLADNGLPAPCHVTQLSVTMTGAGLSASTTANVDIAMDLPLSLLTPDNTPVAPTGTQVRLAPSTAYAAYPPLIVAIRTVDGYISFVEVEQLPERDTSGTVGVRGVATFSKTRSAWNLVFELGGGGEIFDGWGLDVIDQGIWRSPQTTEEISNPGHDKFAYTGSVEPPILATPVQKVFPAPPQFAAADYNQDVLNNRGVPRCLDVYNGKSTGCMQVTYDQKQNVLNAVNGAQVALLTPPAVKLESQTSTSQKLPVQAGAAPTPQQPGSGTMVRLDDPAVAAKLLSAAQSMAAGRNLAPVLAQPVALGSSRAPTGATAISRDYKAEPVSPQEEQIEQLAANQVVNLGNTSGPGLSCVVTGGEWSPQVPPVVGRPPPPPEPVHVSATPSKCKGMHGPVFACPTTGDAIAVETLGTGSKTAMALTATIPPYYAGRQNIKGTCVSHAVTQYMESLFDKYTDDLAHKRTIYVNNDPIVVPVPRVALSVSGGTAQDFDWDSTLTGEPPAASKSDYSANSNGAASLPNFPEAYWLAREPGWNNWAKAAQQTAGNANLCQKCANNKCSDAYWYSSYCMAEGHPGPGVYFSHSQQMQTLQDNPLSDPPWSLANHWFNYIHNTISLDDRDQAIQSVIAEIQGGLPVNMDFDVARAKETPDGSGGTLDVGDSIMTWYLPPELAGCSKAQLDAVLGRKGGHSVDIVGYWVTGTVKAPDPVQSYFILENNWGKDAGYHSFYFINFAAFKYLAYGLNTWRLDWTCLSVACARKPSISPLPPEAILQLEYPPNPADVAATVNYKEVLEQAHAVLGGAQK